MKKIIAVLFILLFGLFVLEGCTTTVQKSDNQQPNQAQPEQQQTQNTGNDKIMQPPALPED